MAQDRTQVINTRLGQRDVEPDKVIHFPRGIIGFDEEREFTLLQIKEESPFLILQSMTTPTLGLLVADPDIVKEKRFFGKCEIGVGHTHAPVELR